MASVRKRKDTWQFQIRKKGHPTFTKTFKVKAHGLAWARKVESEMEQGLVSQTYGKTSEVTLRELIVRYRDTVTPRKRSRVQETNRLNKLLGCLLASKNSSQITSEDICHYRDLRLTEVGSQAVRHDINALSQVFSTAMKEWGLIIQKNPVEGIWKPPISKPRERRLTREEVDLIKDHLKQNCHPDFRDFVTLAMETGMRKGEVLRVKQADLDLSVSVLKLPETKNGYSRTIPLNSVATEVLKHRLRSFSGRLFPFEEPWCRYHWNKLVNAIGIKDLHFHDLRHEAISRFFEMGLSVPEVALISGHKDYRMLARYTHLRAEDVGKKMEKLQAASQSDP